MKNDTSLKFDEVTEENTQAFKDKFATDVEHTSECITETVEAMGELIAKVCKSQQSDLQSVLASITIETFDEHLREILAGKKCNCRKTKHLN